MVLLMFGVVQNGRSLIQTAISVVPSSGTIEHDRRLAGGLVT